MQDFTLAVTNGGYVFRLQSSHHQSVYIRSIKRNFIPVNYTYINKIFYIPTDTQ